MKINIESIPHATHRYPTCGDWWFEPDGTLQIRVSEEIPDTSKQLVILHELAEVIMCQAEGITQEQVDAFDMEYEKRRQPGDKSEPGANVLSPYFAQHTTATEIEVMVAKQMGVDWEEHDSEISKLP